MKGYTSVEAIENYIMTEIELSFYDQIENWIGVMEAYIDKETGRNFLADETATERKYDGDNTKDLLIDDCVEVEKVEIDDEEVDEENYYVYPANDTPKRKITLSGAVFTKGNQNVTITAKWGYSAAVPADIAFAATVLVAGIINYSQNSEGEVKSESILSYTVTYKDEKQWQDLDRAKDILKQYKRYFF